MWHESQVKQLLWLTLFLAAFVVGFGFALSLRHTHTFSHINKDTQTRDRLQEAQQLWRHV